MKGAAMMPKIPAEITDPWMTSNPMSGAGAIVSIGPAEVRACGALGQVDTNPVPKAGIWQ